jgi:transposase
MGGSGSGSGLIYTDDHPRTVEMVKMWEDGVKMDDIAAHFGLSRGYFSDFMRKRRHLFKKRCPSASEEEVTKIWEMYGDGYSVHAIAKALNRSDNLVARVLSE